jgi:hypothetical protein
VALFRSPAYSVNNPVRVSPYPSAVLGQLPKNRETVDWKFGELDWNSLVRDCDLPGVGILQGAIRPNGYDTKILFFRAVPVEPQ